MKRFILSAAVAIAVGLVASEKASAQIVYNYTRPAPGGIVAGGVVAGPTAATSYSTYYSPFTGTVWGRNYYQNSLGTTYGRSYVYNPAIGVMAQNTNFYMPGLYFNPYNGGSFGLNMHPGFNTGPTYPFYGYGGGMYGRRW